MGVNYNLNKAFTNFKGVDLRSSDLLRPQGSASDMLNATYRKTGSISKRLGFHTTTEQAGAAGLNVYANVDSTTGQITEEIICIDSTLRRYTEQTLTVTYSGGASAYTDIYLIEDTVNGNGFFFDLYADNVRVLNFDLGVGVNEASPVTISNLVTAINAVSDFSASASVSTSTPAAFLDLVKDFTITGAGSELSYYSWEVINSPITAPFAATQTKKNNSDFENATFANVNNIVYISTGYDELHKYDGQTLYRAGMPKPDQPTYATSGAGSITNSGLRYITTFIQKDAKGNFTEGIESTQSASSSVTSNAVNVTVDNIVAADGFNTNCAISTSSQSGVNIIEVDDGSSNEPTLAVGDTAYFFDGVSGEYVEREVTAIDYSSAPFTITITGSAVNIANNAVISNNLRIAIYRNQSAGATFSLVAEIPNNSFASTQLYADDTSDANLGADYVTPIKPHGLPPKGKYVSVFRNQLIISGDVESVNTTYYSDIDGPEFFPAGDNSFEVDTVEGDKITGISPINNTFFVFKTKSIHALTGDIVNDKFRVDLISRGEVGCEAHHTIQEVDGKLFFLSSKGVYSVRSAAESPVEESSNIEPVFTAPNVTFVFKKAVALNWLSQNKYILFMPVEGEGSSGNKLATPDSRVYVFDYFRQAWLIWNNINMIGGITVAFDKLFFTERRLGALTGTTERYTHIMQDTGEAQDYADHESAIIFNYSTHWEALGEPSVFKKFLRIKVHSLDVSLRILEADDFSLDIETEQDYIPNTVSSFSLDFSGGRSGGWGVAPWGDFPWGMARIPKLKNKLRSGKAQAIRVIFKNEKALENVLISGYELEVAVPYQPMIKE